MKSKYQDQDHEVEIDQEGLEDLIGNLYNNLKFKIINK